ncbi:MAG: cation:proton antiporter [Spirochaetales bacterium]|nr:cation:proton antiporter [Spirochaetales bacterium]
MEFMLITLAFSVLAGLLMSRAAKLVNLPAVTAYLVAGLCIGPFLLGRLGIKGIGFSSLEYVDSFSIISQAALGFIAFEIGNEFRLKDLKSMGKSAITIGILQAVITTIVVDIALILLHFIAPSLISLSSAITLGAIAAATAPAATLMVVKQYKAEGPMTKLLLMVVAIDDAVGLVLFSVSFGVATALETGAISFIGVVVEPLLELVLSLVLGIMGGVSLNWLEKYFHSRSKRMSLAVAFVLLTVGISLLEWEIGGVHFGFSLLLVCMIEGTVFCNINEASEELMDRVDRWTGPLNMLFFVLSGAELNLNVLSNPLVLIVGLIFIAFRSFGKISGAYLSCRMEKTSPTIQKYLGITLLPQAGVALGMALTARNLSDGEIVRNVVLFAVLVYELVGPTLTKWSLLRAGEIKREGKSNARTPNLEDNKPGITIK